MEASLAFLLLRLLWKLCVEDSGVYLVLLCIRSLIYSFSFFLNHCFLVNFLFFVLFCFFVFVYGFYFCGSFSPFFSSSSFLLPTWTLKSKNDPTAFLSSFSFWFFSFWFVSLCFPFSQTFFGGVGGEFGGGWMERRVGGWSQCILKVVSKRNNWKEKRKRPVNSKTGRKIVHVVFHYFYSDVRMSWLVLQTVQSSL